MCGIAGIISSNPARVHKHRLQTMTDAIVHRGPDGDASWINPGGVAGFGHRRLAIIDLSAQAAQPMHYAGRYSIVYNGEIYNYIELRKELQAKGYAFTSQSDTEVILAAYDDLREDCVNHFDGMFAFAIWDEKEQTLFTARDRFGEKPFYFYCDSQELIFASEIKAIWAAGVEKKINEALLYNFITLGYTQNPTNPGETAFRHIQKLPAASWFSYSLKNQGQVEPVRYWQLKTEQPDAHPDKEDCIEIFSGLFRDSVKKRLRSDVPLGTSLSGGLDSSSIAVIIDQLREGNYRLQTFSASFPGSPADESAYIRLLTERERLDNFTVQPSAEGFMDDFAKLSYYQEGLIGSASVYAQYKVFELAKQHGIKVLLDGQGADETLAGYHKYYHWYWQELYRKKDKWLQHEISSARKLGIADEWSWKNKLAATWPAMVNQLIRQMRKRKQKNAGGLHKDFIAAYGTSYYSLPQQDKLANVLHYNSCCNGLEELLHYADANSMAHGREVRLPFLQYQLVEYVFSLPASFKIRDGYTKWLLRTAMQDQLPAAIAWRKDKVGFEPPQRRWMQQPAIQECIREAKQQLAKRGVITKETAHKKIQPQDSHAADNFDWRYLAASSIF